MVFTKNNPTMTPQEWIDFLKKEGALKAIFQLERGGQTGTPHYQGFVYWPNARCDFAVAKILGCFVECAENEHAARVYVQKEETKEDGPWGFGYPRFKVKPTVKTIKEEELFPWQREVVDIVKGEPDQRTIHWYYEETGNAGKTALAKYLAVHHDAMFMTGKAQDCKCAIARLAEKNKPLPKIVIFGFVRTMEEYVSYQALEEIKDGIFFSGKYESTTIVMDSPHVVVLANFPPDQSKLSQDRWRVVKLV